MAALSNANELWFTVFSWLKQTGNKPNKNFCKLEIATHPDYPALTAVTDFLDAGGMHYNAVEADASYIYEFNYPLLAHIKQPGQEQLRMLNHSSEWESNKELTRYWTGVVIFPEKQSKWTNEENSLFKQKELRHQMNFSLLAAVGFGLLIFAFLQNPSISFALFGLLSLAGIIISVLIIGTELGVQGSLVKQVCGAVSRGGCDSVLKTNYAKGFAGYSTGDISLIYFSAQFVSLLLSIFSPILLNTVVFISLAGLLVAAWSLYMQAFQIRQWCALCLGIVIVLLLQFMIAMINAARQVVDISISPTVLFITIVGIIALLLYPAKGILKTNQQNLKKLTELKRWKTDGGLFLSQLENEQSIDIEIWENDLVLGNPFAPLTIMVACNPYCNPCSLLHKQIDQLLDDYPHKAKFIIRMLSNSNSASNKLTIAVKAILERAARMNSEETRRMLHDWFAMKDFDRWKLEWPSQENEAEVSSFMNQVNKWFVDNTVSFTPTIFIQGRKMPGRYDFSDFQKILPTITAECFI